MHCDQIAAADQDLVDRPHGTVLEALDLDISEQKLLVSVQQVRQSIGPQADPAEHPVVPAEGDELD